VRKALVLSGLAGLLILSACGKDAGSAGSAAGSPAAKSAKSDPSTLGPDGYGGIKLGATLAEIKAAGLEVNNADTPCLGFADFKGPKGYADAQISAKDGVYLISARDPEATPEGVKLGSTLAEVKKAYPQMTDPSGGPPTADSVGMATPVPGNSTATYEIDMKDGKVDSLDLRLKDCTA
jgi:hypothetical protein